ncbi:MAG: NAD(P)-dependent oxidoreductase [Ruminococcus flavefaciens]|nr:NAD(P)-dependent oxidoreductase [Ruminococcus flavefaciens]
MKRVVITGPTGAIGMALIQKCIEAGTEVAAVCHRGSTRIARIPASDKVTVVECSLDEMYRLPQLLEGRYDVFYHLAWAHTAGRRRDDTKAQVQNICYTMDAVEAAAKLGCECFIGAGSQAEYGRVRENLTADTPTFPDNGYGIAKLCAGQMSRLRCGQLGIRHIWFRILSVYGRYDGEQTMVMSSLRQMLRGEAPEYTPAEQMWDYLYSVDAAQAFELAAQRGRDGAVYCLGSGQAQPLRTYIEIMRDEIAPELALQFGSKPYAERQVMYLCADISELQKDTGFMPRIGFREGIRATAQWIRENPLG